MILPTYLAKSRASQVVIVVKNPPANSGDTREASLIPGSGRSPERGHDNPLQYSCLENPHGQRNLEGYSPWDCRESDTTVPLSTHTRDIFGCHTGKGIILMAFSR